MRPLRDLPIRQKLVVVLMLASGGALLVANAGLVAADLVRFRKEMRRNMTSLAAIVAANSTAALTFDDAAAARETLAALRARASITAAALYDARGGLFATYHRQGVPRRRLPVRPEPDGARFTGGRLHVLYPVLLDGERAGTVYLDVSLDETYARLRLQAATVTAVLLAAAGVALLLSSRLQRIISAPILELAETARAVSERQDYSVRAARRSGDELGELVAAFNGMLGQIEQREAALQAAKEELEHRVAERTAELERELAERRRAERKLAERNRELRQSNQELDDFAYVASHDLKEPLRGIHNYSSFLLEDYADRLDEDGRAKLETLTRLTRRMEALIDSLLHFSRVGRVSLDLAEVDLGAVLAEVLDSLGVLLAETGTEVAVPRPLPVLRCDRSKVGELFQNLMTNAVKYNDKERRRVEVGFVDGAGDDPRRAPPVLYVRDNGIGIPGKHLDSIFRIFKRLHGRDAYGGGTGAGLTIAKKIVERHGGRIWVESAPGLGSTFYFTLEKGAPA